MGPSPSTLTAILALTIGFVIPSRASIVRFQCVPGAYLPDSDDCTRYYQCIGEGSIRVLYCPDGTHYCDEGEQQCCSEPIDSEADCESSVDMSDSSTQTIDDNEHVEKSSDVSGINENSAKVQSDEDDTPFDFVGQRFQFMIRNEGLDTNSVDEEYKSTTEHSINEDSASVEEAEEETGTATTTEVDANVVFESDGGPINLSVENEHLNIDSRDQESISQYGDVNNPSSENGKEVDIYETHDTYSEETTVEDEVEDNISIETPENHETSKSSETSNEEMFRWKRNDDITNNEDALSAENIDEDKEKKKNDNKHNQDSDMELSTRISSEERVTEEDQNHPVDSTTRDSVTEGTGNNGDNEGSNPGSDEDDLTISGTPSTDKAITVNPSLVNVHAGGSLAHSYSQQDYKTQQIVQIVKSILRLADEQPYPIHREMLSPESDDHLQTALAL